MMSAAYLLLFVLTIRGTLGQSSGDLRLYTSKSYSSAGRLEMYYSSTWTPFTIDGFDMHQADLACKKLGYSYASRYENVDSLGYSRASTSYSISLSCPSSASTFSSCSYSRTYSYRYHTSDVGLQCTNSRSSLRLRTNSGYYYGVCSGRLEIYVNSTWGTVCDDDFNTTEARVACRQLGFSSYSTYSSASATIGYAGPYGGLIWLDNLNCDYESLDLRQCTNAVGVHNCSHGEDIILTCSGGYVTTPYTSTYSSVPVGLLASLVVVSFFLCSALCVGGVMCAAVIGVVYRKKKIRSPRIIVAQRQPQSASEIGTYHMSDLSAKENEPAPNVFRPVSPVQYAPSPFTPVTLQHDNVHPQNGSRTESEVESSVAEKEIEDNINNLYTSDDEKPLIA